VLDLPPEEGVVKVAQAFSPAFFDTGEDACATPHGWAFTTPSRRQGAMPSPGCSRTFATSGKAEQYDNFVTNKWIVLNM